MKPNIPQIKWDEDKIHRFWDEKSQSGVVYFSEQNGRHLLRLVGEFIAKNATCLDYGCGDGSLVNILLKKDVYVCGADYSKDSVDLVNNRFTGNPKFLGAHLVEELDKKNVLPSFDCIFILEVLEHLYDNDILVLLNRLKNNLSANGITIISVPNEENLDKSQIYCPNCHTYFHHMQHVRTWSENSLVAFLHEQGFDVIRTIRTILRPEESIFKKWARFFYELFKPKRHSLNLIAIVKLKNIT